MVIQAVYENGVFRPIDPVELPENCSVELQIHKPLPVSVQASASAPLAKLAAIADQYSINANLPTDLAEQHDHYHYLYGTAKRS
jgi:predicted DNA-binding antitoxin AbrB/MazE fold protein